MYKTGRTKAGAAAVASHTASMTGDYEVLNQILTGIGIIMPETLNEVEDAIKVLTLLGGKKIRGRRVGILANEGFECSVAVTPFMVTLPAGKDHREDIARKDSNTSVTIDVFEKTDKPMVISLDSGELHGPAVEMMESAGLPCFRKTDRAMKALDVFLRYSNRS